MVQIDVNHDVDSEISAYSSGLLQKQIISLIRVL